MVRIGESESDLPSTTGVADADSASPSSPTRRAGIRAPLDEKIEVLVSDFSGFISEHAKNISVGGTFIATDRPRAVGTELELEYLLDDDYAVIRARGKVSWVRSIPRGRDHPRGMGIRFTWLDDDSTELIHRMVDNWVKEGGVAFDIDRLAPGSVAHEETTSSTSVADLVVSSRFAPGMERTEESKLPTIAPSDRLDGGGAGANGLDLLGPEDGGERRDRPEVTSEAAEHPPEERDALEELPLDRPLAHGEVPEAAALSSTVAVPLDEIRPFDDLPSFEAEFPDDEPSPHQVRPEDFDFDESSEGFLARESATDSDPAEKPDPQELRVSEAGLDTSRDPVDEEESRVDERPPGAEVVASSLDSVEDVPASGHEPAVASALDSLEPTAAEDVDDSSVSLSVSNDELEAVLGRESRLADFGIGPDDSTESTEGSVAGVDLAGSQRTPFAGKPLVEWEETEGTEGEALGQRTEDDADVEETAAATPEAAPPEAATSEAATSDAATSDAATFDTEDPSPSQQPSPPSLDPLTSPSELSSLAATSAAASETPQASPAGWAEATGTPIEELVVGTGSQGPIVPDWTPDETGTLDVGDAVLTLERDEKTPSSFSFRRKTSKLIPLVVLIVLAAAAYRWGDPLLQELNLLLDTPPPVEEVRLADETEIVAVAASSLLDLSQDASDSGPEIGGLADERFVSPAAAITKMAWTEDDSGTTVELWADGVFPAASTLYARLEDPTREVVILRGATAAYPQEQVAVDSADLDSLRFGFRLRESYGELYVVADVAAARHLVRFETEGDRLLLRFER